jgi:CBS-domain-containing membrane protein
VGDRDAGAHVEGGQRRQFVRRLLNDLRAFEMMIERDMIESGIRRIGAVSSEYEDVTRLMQFEDAKVNFRSAARLGLDALISYRTLLRLLARGITSLQHKQIEVSEVMKRDPISIAPDAATLEAVETMRRHKISCLPVVKDERLVGILTERDLVNVAAESLLRLIKE